MSDASGQGEPTMEEILASIRKIIAEDGPEAEDAAVGPDPEPQPELQAEEAEEDVLDLTQVVHEDGTVVDLNAERAAAGRQDEPEPADELDLEDAVEEPAEPAPGMGEPGMVEPVMVGPGMVGPGMVGPGMVGDDNAIISDPTRTAATASLLDLARSTGPGAPVDLATMGGGMTLELLVRDSLRPYLKAWLDEHLATLVERIVREEIQKMVKRAEYR